MRELPYETGPIRLSPFAPRQGRPGHACSDATVAEARRLVEGSDEPLRRIARRLGISPITVSRWALDGDWVRPWSAPQRSGLTHFQPGWTRSPRLFETRQGLRVAELHLRLLEGAPAPAPAAAGPALDRLAEALARLDAAARAYRRPRSCAPEHAGPGRADLHLSPSGDGRPRGFT